ncbi:uncharacterized protein EHS24_007387 [Apiotrichum porosum]|uniref:PNPLA domain-containing protein n=1 Tax=Apiotrichum porosum TaxID=105984 RepID=A0A427XUB4_9TREE|nr:uncharacterized protein EHS24_007387 [Apiotrichum porosum]RSH82419.1 hypothetical protein EHS24_007387 [Apiotrichum porosum]
MNDKPTGSDAAAPPPKPPPSDYSHPKLDCDLVMKGGITSGIVYPLAICQLATVYKLRSVGGASAGAIAAAAAACTEIGRDRGGFEKLYRMPQELSALARGPNSPDSKLFTLFQPQPGMQRLFNLATAGLGLTGAARAWAMVRAALGGWALPTLAGTLPGLAGLGISIAGLSFAGRPIVYVGLSFALVLSLILAVSGGVLALALALLRDVGKMPQKGYGLCDCLTAKDAKFPALTTWMYDTFQDLAGITDGHPITFGTLSDAGVNLMLMTTSLGQSQPLAMPWDKGGYYFNPVEFRKLFPEEVVAAMEAAADRMEALEAARATHLSLTNWESAVRHQQARNRPDGALRMFPRPADLPIIVGVRMSLSFPGLISAVPLYDVDYTYPKNDDAKKSVDATYGTGRTPAQAAAQTIQFQFVLNWFSDGGICANLPLQFFDSVLPLRPTFAIDLASFPPGKSMNVDQMKNTFLAQNNDEGLIRPQNTIGDKGLAGLVSFFTTIVETARGWVDQGQVGMPGYRDRIVTVYHDDDEGGMNLNMKPSTVVALAERGQCAGTHLITKFAGSQPGVVAAPGWDNHRWLRFRTTAAAMSDALSSFEAEYQSVPAGTTAYSDWIGQKHHRPFPSYQIFEDRLPAAVTRTGELLHTATLWQVDPADALTHGAPNPRPTLRLMPPGLTGVRVRPDVLTDIPPPRPTSPQAREEEDEELHQQHHSASHLGLGLPPAADNHLTPVVSNASVESPPVDDAAQPLITPAGSNV